MSLVVAALLFRPEFSTAATMQAEGLGRWGDAVLSRFTNIDGKPVPTTVSDHFGSFHTPLAKGGRYLLTADKGSYWVYDPVHHIAAVSESGDVNGNSIFFLAPPPTTFPARDLSGVVSAGGLRLGMPAERAAVILGVPVSAIVRVSPSKTTLYARKPRRCGFSACSFDSALIFENDKAVAISLDGVGP